MLKIFSGFNRFYKSVYDNTKNKNKKILLLKLKEKWKLLNGSLSR